MKHKFYYMALNLFVPGTGQISAKRYIRGIIQALSSIAAVLWFAYELAMPFIEFYNGDITQDKLPEINFVSMLMPLFLFSAMLVWSIIDLMFGFNKKTEKQ